jgi:dipeptidyl aminopeptidase/acylaminoacyl peptidase
MGLRMLHASAVLAMVSAVPSAAAQQRQAADGAMAAAAALRPAVLLSPDRSKLLLMEKTPADAGPAATPTELRVAGARVRPQTNSGPPGQTYSALIVQPIGRGEIRRLILPWKARVSSVLWSPDGHRVAFTILEDNGLSLWLGDAYSGVIRMLAGPVLNGVQGEPCQWFPSGDELLCSRVPAGRGGQPVTGGDPALVGHFFTSQLVAISQSGTERVLGKPGIHGQVAISPDEKYLLVETLSPAGSERFELDRFPVRTELWDGSAGTVLKVLGERKPAARSASAPDQVAPGPRGFRWRGDKSSTLVWAEAVDGGDPSAKAPVRDRLFQQDSPFQDAAAPFAALAWRSRDVVWDSHDRAIVTEAWAASGRARSWIIAADGSGTPRLLSDSVSEGFLTRRSRQGGEVLVTAKDGRIAYLRQAGGPRSQSYLARIDLVTGKVQRLWQTEAPAREVVVGMMDSDEAQLITLRESGAEASNYFLRDLRKKGVTQLTRFK